MGIFDGIVQAIAGSLGEGQGAELRSLAFSVLAQAESGGVQAILAKLNQGGMATEVQSWLGSGTNLPISAEQLRSALGDRHIAEIAGRFGIPTDQALQYLSQHLPTMVSDASAAGTLSPPATQA